jgi:glutamate formiminotransferase/formiminotetrahydrofolate cyclodeaminase
MSRFECVPNFSEGRNEATIERIVRAAGSVAGVSVLDVERNADHHRSVVTLVGEGSALVEGVLAAMRVATELIDLNHHRGEHPRMGATDVVPFIPLGSARMEEAVEWARRLGDRVARELAIPVYLYGLAARRPERVDLARVREGQFEGLREAIGRDPSRAPDFGEPRLHPTAGAVAVGARPVLIAYNAYLTSSDVSVAKKVAHAVRARDGGLVEVKALGFEIRERQRAQVSMNLTDYRRTPIHRALEAVRREAARYGAGIEESEIVGLVPEDALLDAAEYYLQLNRFDRATLLERKVAAVDSARPGRELIADFTARLAARTPTPGGGSAAAIAGALGTALGEMVFAYTHPAGAAPPDWTAATAELTGLRQRFLELSDEDGASYEAVRAARKALKEHPDDPDRRAGEQAALRRATLVPLETARRANRGLQLLTERGPATKPALRSDLATARALLEAARSGGIANARVNRDDLRAAGVATEEYDAEISALEGRP